MTIRDHSLFPSNARAHAGRSEKAREKAHRREGLDRRRLLPRSASLQEEWCRKEGVNALSVCWDGIAVLIRSLKDVNII